MKNYRGIIVCGARKTGKTTLIKEKLLKKYPGRKFIYDVNKEYPGGVMMDMDQFLNISTQLQNSIILFEEATIFFDNKGSVKEVREMLVRARHSNVILVFAFHALQFVPLNILSMCDVLILKRTNDNEGLITKKFKDSPKIITAFYALRRLPKYSHISIRLGV